ncbi:SURF1 family protein [Massilia sp. 2TAF26]|uniref:SURF1 family protein n=1 Tax=Massilia sp. 2TAF26 TaxID=3233012 RepID=UPI003F98F023
MRLRFHFRTVPFLATLVLVVLGIVLGNWQTRRAAEKTVLQTRLEQGMAAPPLRLDGGAVDPATLEFHRVIVTGEFVPNWPVFLDNRPQDGRSGFVLLMPFKIAGSSKSVLVARGWLPRNTAEHDKLPPYTTPAGQVTLEGRAVRQLARVMQLGTAAPLAPNAIVQNTDPADVARASGLDLLPVVVEQTGPGTPGDGLTRNWPMPSLDIDRHKGYAVQWYALAAMAFLFFVITGFRRGTKQAG